MLQKGVRTGEGLVYPTIRYWCDRPTKIALPNDVLLSVRAPVGPTNLCNEKSIIGRGLSAIRASKIVDYKYLLYFFRSIEPKLSSQGRGSTFSAITQSEIREIEFPLPDLKTQQKIASILEQVDIARQKRKDANRLTEQFLQSAFLEMFGDPVRNEKGWNKLKADKLFDMKLGKMLSAKNYTGKHLKPYLRNINVQWGRIDFSDIKQMDFDEREFERYELRKGDILVCEGGEVGRTAIYNGEIENCCYQNALHRLRIKNKLIEPNYFLSFMFHAATRGMIIRETSTVTIAHFTSEKFKEFEIPIPPIPLQNKYASLVDQVEQLQRKQSVSERELNILFNSLMQKYFE